MTRVYHPTGSYLVVSRAPSPPRRDRSPLKA